MDSEDQEDFFEKCVSFCVSYIKMRKFFKMKYFNTYEYILGYKISKLKKYFMKNTFLLFLLISFLNYNYFFLQLFIKVN